MLRTTWRKLETGLRDGLRHRKMAKAAGNSYPQSAYRYRASRRLYPFPQPTPGALQGIDGVGGAGGRRETFSEADARRKGS